MDQAKRDEYKEQFLKILKGLGFKVIYDLDKENQHNIYDIYMLVSKNDPDEDEAVRQRFVPLVITYSAELSFMNMGDYLKRGADGIAEYSHGLENWVALNYSIDDLVCLLLHSGYHLKDIYQFINGKGRFKFTPSIVKLIVDNMNLKGSPLRSVKQNELYQKKKKPFKHVNRPNIMQYVEKRP
jgi:uncharacterized protein YfkK (UPF0435 family)